MPNLCTSILWLLPRFPLTIALSTQNKTNKHIHLNISAVTKRYYCILAKTRPCTYHPQCPFSLELGKGLNQQTPKMRTSGLTGLPKGELWTRKPLDRELSAKTVEHKTKRNLLTALENSSKHKKLKEVCSTIPVFLIVPEAVRSLFQSHCCQIVWTHGWTFLTSFLLCTMGITFPVLPDC